MTIHINSSFYLRHRNLHHQQWLMVEKTSSINHWSIWQTSANHWNLTIHIISSYEDMLMITNYHWSIWYQSSTNHRKWPFRSIRSKPNYRKNLKNKTNHITYDIHHQPTIPPVFCAEARLLFRLSLASALAVVFRQLLFGAFKRHGHEAQRPAQHRDGNGTSTGGEWLTGKSPNWREDLHRKITDFHGPLSILDGILDGVSNGWVMDFHWICFWFVMDNKWFLVG